jgi:exodeoxyribonuclease VII large subunit
MADLFDLPFEDVPDTEDPAPDAHTVRPAAASSPDQRASTIKSAAPASRSQSATPAPPTPVKPAAPTTRGESRPSPSPDQHPGSGPRRALSVTQLTLRLRDLLESEFFEVWVEGELSNCRPWNTGHLYFTLKDTGAQVKGVIFRSALRYLRFKPEDGLKVIARGRISVYEPKGEYQLVCEHLEPQGFGALQLAFEQLKARLQEEGLFDAARKRPLPALPRKIGIVTSLDGAAIRDMLKVLGRRHSSAHVIIKPARVQGEGASVEIARGLKALGRTEGVDVIIVGRGGGSIEDLWAFNEEIVARAIVLCPVPVISAVGHETDVTIADFVADLRAPTPSAAAEMVIAAKDEFCSRIDRLTDRLRSGVRAQIKTLHRRVLVLTGRPAFAGFPGRVANQGRRAAELTHSLGQATRSAILSRERQFHQLRRRLETCDLGRRLGAVRTRLMTADARAAAAMSRQMHRRNTTLRETAGRLDSLSPLAVLARGYAVCWDADRTHVLRDAAASAPGDRVTVTLSRGELHCEVRNRVVPDPDEH